MQRNWIAVASADHARRGRDEMTPGFMQVCHGKCEPLKRMRAGDRVAYYAPTVNMGGAERCQRFVSIGVVLPGEPYAFDMVGGVGFARCGQRCDGPAATACLTLRFPDAPCRPPVPACTAHPWAPFVHRRVVGAAAGGV